MTKWLHYSWHAYRDSDVDDQIPLESIRSSPTASPARLSAYCHRSRWSDRTRPARWMHRGESRTARKAWPNEMCWTTCNGWPNRFRFRLTTARVVLRAARLSGRGRCRRQCPTVALVAPMPDRIRSLCFLGKIIDRGKLFWEQIVGVYRPIMVSTSTNIIERSEFHAARMSQLKFYWKTSWATKTRVTPVWQASVLP